MTRPYFYRLDPEIGNGKVPVPVDSASLMTNEHIGKRVCLTLLDDVVISTTFLGIDHAYLPDSPPILFETMVFTRESWEGREAGVGHLKEVGNYQRRDSTWESAEFTHDETVEAFRQLIIGKVQ